MAQRKIAMVKPVPSRPAKPAAVERLEDILTKLGNDRPYFVISSKADSWVVHFSGDSKPSTIALVDGKWVCHQ